MTTICILFSAPLPAPPLVATIMMDTQTKEESKSAIGWWDRHSFHVVPTSLAYMQESPRKAMGYIVDTIAEGTGFETKYVLPDETCECKIITE